MITENTLFFLMIKDEKAAYFKEGDYLVSI